VPDRRAHRGPHPTDTEHFAPSQWPLLAAAIDDACWLLSRGYPSAATLKLVGDRYRLVARQRTAVARCSCSDTARDQRQSREVPAAELAGRALWLDGYNVLTTIEAALGGGVILPGREGCYRDLASMHGSFRAVAETRPALELLGEVLRELRCSACVWYLDRPVSNSGRLGQLITALAAREGWPWQVDLVADPDRVLAASQEVVATADSAVLDKGPRWFNLARYTIGRNVPQANVLGLPGAGNRPPR